MRISDCGFQIADCGFIIGTLNEQKPHRSYLLSVICYSLKGILPVLYKMAERSVSLILVILGNLDHFSHSFIPSYQFVVLRCWNKDKYDKVEPITNN
ncbi:hypothetical protein JY97_00335 [Alkalispirochaeta odontotermitis]|nr:hypothetical protein JY97_00335 [Alkalispirochaeta odontotermitis]CAB1083547.1 hypothetical protein D1AOALGA4SA_11108 [Olavius algarvensis Delta 1 endosymbiont]